MAQAFTCNCATSSCRGTISGARDMAPAQLEGVWLSAHIRGLLEEQEQQHRRVAGGKLVGGAGEGDGASARREGVTSRELGGEMGGDTTTV